MKNNGLFSTLFIEDVRDEIELDDQARGRMATLAQTWSTSKRQDAEALWGTFMKQALGYLQFVPANAPSSPGIYPLYEDFGFENCIALLFLVEPDADIDDTAVGRFWPAKLIVELKRRKLNWGILTDGSVWRLYSTKSSRPYEDYVELPLAEALEADDEAEYGLFERFFHKDSFIAEEPAEDQEQAEQDEAAGVYKCRLDTDQGDSENILDEWVKKPLLAQIDEILRYLCNGFIADTPRKGEEYTEEERTDILESSVKLLYRCLFLFYAEARRLLPSEEDKAEIYQKHSIRALCEEARKFRWGQRTDTDGYDLWKHFNGLINAVNDGDPEYGVMGYNGGLFDDEEEVFLGRHKLRNDFFARPLYLLAYVEPYNSDPDDEYAIPYEDLEVRHLGELYENILEYTVMLADADRIRRRTKKGVQFLLASETTKEKNDSLIRKGDVYFGESALERKQTGSYYTPESLVRFLNAKAIIEPLREKFEADYRERFDKFLAQASENYQAASAASAIRSAAALVKRYVDEVVLPFRACDPAMGSGHFLVDAANQMAGLVVELLAEIPPIAKLGTEIISDPNDWRRRITRHCLYGVDLNPLAVNLAKLSLWLNCFATQHRLTFLDNHLWCGNSLIGLRDLNDLRTVPKRKKDGKKKATKQADLPFEELPDVLGDAAKKTRSITAIDEDDTDQQKEAFEEAHETADAMIAPLADLHTAYLMDYDIDQDDYRFLFRHFAEGNSADDLPAGRLAEIWEAVEAYQDYHNFFHWPVRFPEVFGPDGDGGFSATVGNPPWDMSVANPQEFFSAYDPAFRKLNRTDSLKRISQICSSNPVISDKWETHQDSFNEQNQYMNEPSAYAYAPTGRNNLFQYFLHRCVDLLRPQGYLGLVVPSGIYTDKGCTPLRKLLFRRSRIHLLLCFENRRGIFNIHRMFKFVLLVAQAGGKTASLKCAFMKHDPGRLPAIDSHAMSLPVSLVKKTAPSTLSVMEFNTKDELEIANNIYGEHPLLEETPDGNWGVTFSIEFMSNTDAFRFDGVANGVPVYAGKNFWQFDHQFSPATKFIPVDHLEEYYADRPEALKEFRLAFRDISASTNERTCVATVLAPPTACLETARLIYPVAPAGPSAHSKAAIQNSLLLFLNAALDSFCVDFVLRKMVTSHLSQHIMVRVPIPRVDLSADVVARSITARCARLVCVEKAYSRLWESVCDVVGTGEDVWHGDYSTVGSYGPAEEQRVRDQLLDTLNGLDRRWQAKCAAKDRTEDRRDVGDRAQLRAEIDAYVAHLYGLSRDDFEYILGTFPVLERKERAAFGEFMSKRKCLEEYDRIGAIL